MTTIKFRDWDLIVDKEQNKTIYDKVVIDSRSSCTCQECCFFVKNRENIYPSEIKILLSNIGIDYHKECGVYHFQKDELGIVYYIGWFHFKGRFKRKTLSTTKDEAMKKSGLIKISDLFSIGFLYDDYQTFFDEKDDLVKVEFETKVFVPYL
jgi:hypothetical protein